MDGFFVVDKPVGPTSHDIVAQVRRALGGARVGHAGTLDPLASGLLVLCVGRATRLSDEAMAARKRYHAEIVLGISTDTYDRLGTVVSTSPVMVDAGAIRRVATSFVGTIQQVPPMYSAIKVGGRKLYDLARAGNVVARQPREVRIEEVAVLAWAPPRLTIELSCSKGTYVRSFAHELGEQLGTGAHLAELRRLASGGFTIDDAVTLDELIGDIAVGNGERWLLPLDTVLPGWLALVLAGQRLNDFAHGRTVGIPVAAEWQQDTARVYSPDGQLCGVVRLAGAVAHPLKVLM